MIVWLFIANGGIDAANGFTLLEDADQPDDYIDDDEEQNGPPVKSSLVDTNHQPENKEGTD